ncbi:methylmalonyl-CoA mutase family protein [Mesorhizobium sp. M2C.T.Ca.TU.002.02.1.1]|uniref:methylmalonyl-CoA mutase family protein n=1 Tax=Mesorhizobium sp. M2C.T.Ca.TU.002.02.1.1 TaxID=2496788 RepID=UPI000FCAFBDD|nr:methylmalonyl-CoA mutase family protein [Mesorhizobium sp. M2C.T.Ca.TU.002.02.1.1]RUU57116.1 methylmalonyl-CoA mutase [Mesorhizobium sp. M2C.T.Ca.TU.002.02.1.1]RUU71922.1 methylmalonyl-CoA mutase [Mesorhizobium sp. M2C.T.Ca.TU.009.01.2.1]
MNLFSETAIEDIREKQAAWEEKELAAALAGRPEEKPAYETECGIPLKRVYTAADIADIPADELGFPGAYPFTRGAYPTMYRGRPWTIRQVAGFGNPEATNQRYKYMIQTGQTGLSTDFDLPTLLGLDSDDPRAFGEVGRVGVAIDTVDDVDRLFDGIDLEKISVSLTINPSAWVVYAMYVAVAERRGYDLHKLAGTLQADPLKEYVAQKEWIYPVRPAVRLLRDLIMYSAKATPKINPISLSGYHLSDVGGNALQEIAFIMAFTIAYCEEVTGAGMDIDDFAPRLSFFFISHQDFFEQICKFRAARRVYAKIMARRFKARKPESMRLRVHVQTAAMSLTKVEHHNNLMRTAIQALGAVLGGCQSMHTNGLDEAFAIPTEEAMKLAIRTQQIIRDEINVTSVIDPLGGSYFIERLTRDMETEIWKLLDEVDERGGAVKLVEEGWFQQKLADSAYATFQKIDAGEKISVGVNRYVDEASRSAEVHIHPYDEACTQLQIDRLQAVRASRDNARVRELLKDLAEQARSDDINLLPKTIEAVKAKATLGEICAALREVWGAYAEPMIV